jgi:hypothetical protein
MPTRRVTSVLLLLSVLSFGVIGCSGASRSGGGETLTVNEALTQIQGQGLSVSPLRSLSPGFAQDGLLAETEYGDRIRIVEFQNTSSASMQVSRKSSSAGSSPFFYQKGNIMVVHLGNDSRVEDALEAVLGPKEQ